MAKVRQTIFRNQFRLREVQNQPGPVWLFLPGGAGLGSEYLESLIDCINLPGTLYLVDFPGDGSNLSPLQPEKWKEGLAAVARSFGKVHLFAHSFAAMFVMTCPELEKHVESLILMSPSPKKFTHHAKGPIQLKEYFFSRIDQYVLPESRELALRLFENLPYNNEAFLWVRDHFHPNFNPTWVPKQIPTLIFTGDHDKICPLTSFEGSLYQGHQNIEFESIRDASHFPWLEKPQCVSDLLKSRCR